MKKDKFDSAFPIRMYRTMRRDLEFLATKARRRDLSDYIREVLQQQIDKDPDVPSKHPEIRVPIERPPRRQELKLFGPPGRKKLRLRARKKRLKRSIKTAKKQK